MNKIRLLLADDHAILRAALRTLFEGEPDIEVVAEAADGEETVRKARETTPDVVLMDITMPGMNGLEATQQIKIRNPATKVLALTAHEDEYHLLQAFRAGADGYLPKKAAHAELVIAIRATFRGEHFIHPSMTEGLISELRHGQAAGSAISLVDGRLSERDQEVLQLVAQGHTDQGIADSLCLSVKTVAKYKARVKDKLRLSSRAELCRYAVQTGLFDTGTRIPDAAH